MVDYKQAGVDIDAGNQLVDMIKPLVAATKISGADSDIGGFGGVFDLAKLNYQDPVLVAATDGVGTKLHIAQQIDKHDTIGIDLVAMCVNDLVVQAARPIFFLDYFATGKLDVMAAKSVIAGIAQGCQIAGCALIGGETAEMPGMYGRGVYDLAGFAVGIAERKDLLPKAETIAAGDVIIGIASSGIHSNGYSLVRYIMSQNNISYDMVAEFDEHHRTIGELLLEPTKIYVKSCLELLENIAVKAFAHITGGGFTENIPRVLPDGCDFKIEPNSWPRMEVFSWLQAMGNISDDELLRTFNCGIGMVAIIAQDEQDKMLDILEKLGEQAWVIGSIV